jgi:hypothetical protein
MIVREIGTLKAVSESLRWLAYCTMPVLALSTAAAGQASNPFGVQDRADAVQSMIVLAVEQGIASLPPTSGQSFTYEYDPKADTYRKSEEMGPTAFRSTQTIGAGRLNVRLAESYFSATRTLGPIDYSYNQQPPFTGPTENCTRFGVIASTEVALTDLSATYGLAKSADVSINIPLVSTDTHASEVHLTSPNFMNSDRVPPVPCGQIDTNIKRGLLTFVTRSFASIPGGKVQFNDGTNVGLGRISVGGKFKFYSTPRLQLAFAPQFFVPSPNQAVFAGSDSAAISPRIIGQLTLRNSLRLHTDVGYDYDFSHNELRRLAWNVGASLPFSLLAQAITVDFGVGGSHFNEGITWTPAQTSHFDQTGQEDSRFQALSSNTLGDTFVDFLGGIKVAITKKWVISGAVDMPLNGEGFRPDAVGTIAAEFYL